MYEQFFGFRERPFDLTPNPRYLVLTDVHREALSNLEYGIVSHKGITLLIGEAGSGKTTLIRSAIEKQPARVHCIHLSNPALSRAEFIEMLAERFGLTSAAKTSKTTMLLQLEALLRARREAGETTVLIVDEAQSLSVELFEEVRLLANIEANDEKLLLVIIAGQPELIDRLNDKRLRQLKQRIALRCELRPLTLQETAAYLAGRIKAAGGVGAQVFTREAVTRIFESAHGIPRVTNVIADNALLSAYAQDRRPVTSAMVDEVCRDFDLAGHTVAAAPPAAQSANGRADVTATSAANRILDMKPDLVLRSADLPTRTGAAVDSDVSEDPLRWLRFFFERRSGNR
ncbi:MAG: AAA family ATPase [Acidobacteria bacterium]|nr:AAA family ATPase [Acidobacteriota bacterium]